MNISFNANVYCERECNYDIMLEVIILIDNKNFNQ